MKSAARGKRTSDVEVTNVSEHGFWLLVHGRELYLAFEHFPWFRDVTIADILHVELPHPGHLYWPDLDVDLAVESIEHPERFPLVSASPVKGRAVRRVSRRGGSARSASRTRGRR